MKNTGTQNLRSDNAGQEFVAYVRASNGADLEKI